MDQSKSEQLSPVLELSYITLTHIAHYIDVYAADIKATNLEQFTRIHAALESALKAFDEVFAMSADTDAEDEDQADKVYAGEQTPSAVQPARPAVQSQTQAVQAPYQFASGDDEESLKKAQQAVEELKALFTEMKQQEEAQRQTQQQSVPAPVQVPVVTAPKVAPVVPPVVSQPQPTQAPTAQQDAGEIDSILAELRKLQNKGSQTL